MCDDVGQGGEDKCLFEVRTAFDCLYRHKVRKGGDFNDNRGACRHHISNMKEALGEGHADYLDDKISSIVYARHSLV